MIPTMTSELQRHVHETRAAQLHSSMHRPPTYVMRHLIGSQLVAIGLRLAPEERLRQATGTPA